MTKTETAKVPQLKIEKLNFALEDGRRIFKDFNFECEAGDFWAVLGRNGSGKSTLFRLITGLEEANAGKFLYQGEEYASSKKKLKKMRKKIAYVFQDPDQQLFAPTVYQELAFAPVNFGMPEDEIKERIKEMAEKTGIEELLERPVHQLSFGEKKRVSIAAGLIYKPEILLLDEPSAWLDPENRGRISKILKTLNAEGISILLASHNIEWAANLASKALILEKNGQYAGFDTSELKNQKELLAGAGLLSEDR